MEPQDYDELRRTLARIAQHQERLNQDHRPMPAMPDLAAVEEKARQEAERWAHERRSTVAQVRKMLKDKVHPTWIQAAYVDLAQRFERVEARLDEMSDTLRMILGQLAALEREQDQGHEKG